MKPIQQAILPHPWLNAPSNPAPGHQAWVVVRPTGEARQLAVMFNPTQAATIGRLLMDWANKADPGAALAAVGSLMTARGGQ